MAGFGNVVAQSTAQSPCAATMRRMPATPIHLASPVRLRPGEDLRLALQAVVAARGLSAAFVLAGIGSLQPAACAWPGPTSRRNWSAIWSC
jgi:predicted DNA-binding protein with PD1-like motif